MNCRIDEDEDDSSKHDKIILARPIFLYMALSCVFICKLSYKPKICQFAAMFVPYLGVILVKVLK